jgi:hypothetical protein
MQGRRMSMSIGRGRHLLAAEAKLLGAGMFSPETGILPKAAVLAGLSYILLPIDLIPDRIPVLGYSDDVGFALAGLVVCRLLVATGSVFPLPRPQKAFHLATRRALRRTAHTWRRSARGSLAPVVPALVRLGLGRWPDAEERRRCIEALRRPNHPLPPVLRSLSAFPAGRGMLTRATLLSWSAEADGSSIPEADALRGNPLRVWDGPPVSFLHIEKTAGSSVLKFLEARFHPLQIDLDPFRAMPPHLCTAFAPCAAPQIRRRLLVAGHYDLPALRRLDADRFILAFFREPRQRIVSLYRFWRSLHQHAAEPWRQSFGVRMAHMLDLRDFLRSGDPMLRDYIDNCYARRLTGLYATGAAADPLAADADAALRQALAALDRLACIGITEQLGDSLRLLAAVLGTEPPDEVPQANTLAGIAADPAMTRAPETVDAGGQEIAAELDRLTTLDRAIYAAARRRFAALRTEVLLAG